MPVITWTMQAYQKPTDAAEWEDIINESFGAHGGEVTIDVGEKRLCSSAERPRSGDQEPPGRRQAGRHVAPGRLSARAAVPTSP